MSVESVQVAVGYCQLPSDSATVLNMPKSEQTREGRSLGREATVPGIVVDAKPVTARLAHGVFPMQVTAGGQPMVEYPLLQVLHDCLIPPHPVPCSTCCPASGKHTLC